MTLLPALLLAQTASGFSFLSVGDWGGSDLGGPYDWVSTTVKQVASAMADQQDTNFVINTGDNFYWCGIQNVSDFQVQADWVKPFLSYKSLQVPWYGILGNHEYGYNVSAQLELPKHYPHWVMDDRYYSRRIALADGQHMTFIAIDTSPCVKEYRADNKDNWDPCSTRYPTCSIVSGKDQFEGACLFHEHILTQDCTAQYDWLKAELKKVPEDDWLIVAGHHPADEIDVEDFTGLLQQYPVKLYLNGHIHTLNQYTIDGDGYYITTGAGSLVQTDDQSQGHAVTKLAGGSVNSSKHSYDTVWTQKVAGFTRHVFNDDFTSLETSFINYNGDVIHSFTVDK